MNHLEQEENQQIGIVQQANEYRQKSSNTMYVISFLFGLLIIITGYITLKAINDYIGWWATLLIIIFVSIHVARKL